MADELDALLEKVVEPGLQVRLTAVDLVRSKRSFGLVFDSHLSKRVSPIDSSAC